MVVLAKVGMEPRFVSTQKVNAAQKVACGTRMGSAAILREGPSPMTAVR
jgi:hypothetical protein